MGCYWGIPMTMETPYKQSSNYIKVHCLWSLSGCGQACLAQKGAFKLVFLSPLERRIAATTSCCLKKWLKMGDIKILRKVSSNMGCVTLIPCPRRFRSDPLHFSSSSFWARLVASKWRQKKCSFHAQPLTALTHLRVFFQPEIGSAQQQDVKRLDPMSFAAVFWWFIWQLDNVRKT